MHIILSAFVNSMKFTIYDVFKNGYSQQCGDCRVGRVWMEVEEDIGEING